MGPATAGCAAEKARASIAPQEWPTRAGEPSGIASMTSRRSSMWRATDNGRSPLPRWIGSKTRNVPARSLATGAMEPPAPGPPWMATTAGPREPYVRTSIVNVALGLGGEVLWIQRKAAPAPWHLLSGHFATAGRGVISMPLLATASNRKVRVRLNERLRCVQLQA